MSTSWIPEACTLPTGDQVGRVQEFDNLLADSARDVKRLDARRVRVVLDPSPEVAARAADLAVRETSCCGFLTFTLTAADHQLRMDVSVPEARVDVLDALTARVGT
jgi:hypothetical protein